MAGCEKKVRGRSQNVKISEIFGGDANQIKVRILNFLLHSGIEIPEIEIFFGTLVSLFAPLQTNAQQFLRETGLSDEVTKAPPGPHTLIRYQLSCS